MEEVTVIVVWDFSPPNYFEEKITISRSDYTMIIENGKVEARTTAAIYDANASMRDTLYVALNDRFLGVQLLSHTPYVLSRPKVTKVHPNGRQEIFIELEGAQLEFSAGSLDVQVADQQGNVVSDSKADRIEEKKNLAELVTKYGSTDSVLGELLKSNSAGVRDPDNELVHLFEIQEALCKRFRNESAAMSTLSIDTPHWNRFGRICNDKNIRQGRHRGQNVRGLRDATDAELMEARGMARSMIEAYLQFLDSSGAPNK